MKEGSPITPPPELIPPAEGFVFPKNGVVFDAQKEKMMRHNKNLHGDGHLVDGLTGYYRGKYYRDGLYQPPKKNK